MKLGHDVLEWESIVLAAAGTHFRGGMADPLVVVADTLNNLCRVKQIKMKPNDPNMTYIQKTMHELGSQDI